MKLSFSSFRCINAAVYGAIILGALSSCGGGGGSTPTASAGPAVASERVSELTATQDVFAPTTVLELPFDEGKGTRANDASGNNRYGTINGAIWEPRDSDFALHFTGSEQVFIRDADVLDMIGHASISVWVKIDNPELYTSMRILSKKNDFEDVDGYELEYNPGTNTLAFIGSGSSVSYASNVDLDTTWHHIGIAITDETVALYVDGQNVSTGVTITPIVAGETALRIGRNNLGQVGFQGSIDDICFYTSALNSAQMQDLAGTAVTGIYDADENGLVAHWSCDEGSGSALVNKTTQSSLSLRGTVMNSKWTSSLQGAADSLTGTGALSCNGTDSYALIDDGEALAFESEMSIAAWIKIDDPDLNSYMRIVSKKYGWDALEGYELEYNPANNTLSFLGGGGDVAHGYADLDTGWHHVAASVSGQTATLFVDGKDVTWDSSVGALQTSAEALLIGRHSLNGPAFAGDIDEVRLYDRALSLAEVLALSRTASGKIAHWTFDGGNSRKATDSSGNGMILSAPLNIDGSTVGVTGRSAGIRGDDRAYRGRYLDDRLMAQTLPQNLSLEKNLTLMAWTKVSDVSELRAMRIISKKEVWNGNTGYELEYNPKTKRITAIGSGPDVAYADFDLGTDWHHVAALYDGSVCTIYVDGVDRTTNSSLDSVVAGPDAFVIGGHSSESQDYFNGLIDDVRVYDNIQSREQILDCMATGLGESTLVRITAPASGTVVRSSDDVLFTAFSYVADPDELGGGTYGDSSGLSWESDLAGVLVSGVDNHIATAGSLAVGTHLISFGGDSVSLTIAETLITDKSGNERHGVAIGGAQVVFDTERNSHVLSLSGLSAYLENGLNDNFLNGQQQISISMWVKSNEKSSNRGIFRARPADSFAGTAFRFDKRGTTSRKSNIIEASLDTTGGRLRVESASDVQTDQWVHVVMSWQGNKGGGIQDKLHLYINGVETVPNYDSGTASGEIRNATQFIIGGGPSKISDTNAWNGFVDDVRVYNWALDPQAPSGFNEVQEVYNETANAPVPSLLHWDFETLNGNG